MYCKTRDNCASVYLYIHDFLGADFTFPPGSPDLPGFHVVDMYMSTEEIVKNGFFKSHLH